MAAQKSVLRLTRPEFEALAAAVALADVEFESDQRLTRRIGAAWAKVKADFYGS